MLGIKIVLLTDCLSDFYGEKYNSFSSFLLLTDVILLADSVLLFAVLGKIVSSISYDAHKDDLKITHLNNWGLKPQ